MEKKTLRAVMAAFLMAAVPAFAGTDSVTADQAKALVQAWSAENRGGFGLGGASVVSATPFADADGTVLWYAVALSDGSCVFTAADRRIDPVIAVVPNCAGTPSAGNPLRALLERDLRGRLAAVSASGARLQSVAAPAAKGVAAAVRAARAQWTRLVGGASLQDLSPSIATPNGNPPVTMAYLPGFSDGSLTHWSQSFEKASFDESSSTWPLTSVYAPLYNYYTPSHYVCGCVATAASAVLQYYNVTNGPVGFSNTCSVNGEKRVLTTIGGLYDWSILPSGMGGQAPAYNILNEAQRELLGRVAYDMGVCVGMQYGGNGGGSGAAGDAPAEVFTTHYGFETAVSFKLPKDLTADVWSRAIYNHLRCDSPVILGISKKDSNGPGHEVLAVGYGVDRSGGDYVRVFMGWGGSSDAWYQLPKIGEYDVVDTVIGSISVDGAAVPFCGQVKNAEGLGVVGAEVCIPGVTNVLTGANGLFAFRLTEEEVAGLAEDPEAADDGEEGEEGEDETPSQVVKIQVKAGATVMDVEVAVGEDMSQLESLPAAITVTLPEDAVAVPCAISPEEAAFRAKNSQPERMVVLLSGRDGDPGTELVKAYLAANAEAFNEKFVLYYADYETDGYYLQDGLPSIGVFSPRTFQTDRGWQLGNGRLSYVSDEEGVAPTEAQVQEVLDTATTRWNLLNSGVTLSVSGGYYTVNRRSLEKALEGVEETYAVLDVCEDPLEYATGYSSEELVALPAGELLQALKDLKEDLADWGEWVEEELEYLEEEIGAYVLSYVLEGGDPDALEEDEEYVEMALEWATLKKLESLIDRDMKNLDGVKTWEALPGGFGADPALGTYRNVYTNGQEIVLSCPPVYTNVTRGIAYACTGYEVYCRDAENGNLLSEESDTGTTVTLDVAAPYIEFRWYVEPKLYRISATTNWINSKIGGQVTPTEVWAESGATVEFTASPNVVESTTGLRAGVFYQWMDPDNYTESPDIDALVLTNDVVAAISVLDRPRNIVAVFRNDANYYRESAKVTVGVNPKELEDLAPKTAFGGIELAYGSTPNDMPPGQISLTVAATNFVGVGGTNWVLVGWQAGGVTNAEARAKFTLERNGTADIEWIWSPVTMTDVQTAYAIEWTNGLDNLNAEYTTNLVSTADLAAAGMTLADLDVTAPHGFKVIVSESEGNVVAKLELDEEALRPQTGSGLEIDTLPDGSLLVSGTVVNGVRGFWYALYSADELGGPWSLVSAGEYAAGRPAEQAIADTEIAVTIMVEPDQVQKFYKLKVTDGNPALKN